MAICLQEGPWNEVLSCSLVIANFLVNLTVYSPLKEVNSFHVSVTFTTLCDWLKISPHLNNQSDTKTKPSLYLVIRVFPRLAPTVWICFVFLLAGRAVNVYYDWPL